MLQSMALCGALSRLTLASLPFAPTSFSSVKETTTTSLHFSRSSKLVTASPFVSSVAASSFPARAGVVVCYNSGYNVQIVVGEAEAEEALLRRFRREVSRAGIIQECKRRRFFENHQDEKKRKAREAGRRNRRRRQTGPRFPSSSAEEGVASKRASDDDDDNWDLPEGDITY